MGEQQIRPFGGTVAAPRSVGRSWLTPDFRPAPVILPTLPRGWTGVPDVDGVSYNPADMAPPHKGTEGQEGYQMSTINHMIQMKGGTERLSSILLGAPIFLARTEPFGGLSKPTDYLPLWELNFRMDASVRIKTGQMSGGQRGDDLRPPKSARVEDAYDIEGRNSYPPTAGHKKSFAEMFTFAGFAYRFNPDAPIPANSELKNIDLALANHLIMGNLFDPEVQVGMKVALAVKYVSGTEYLNFYGMGGNIVGRPTTAMVPQVVGINLGYGREPRTNSGSDGHPDKYDIGSRRTVTNTLFDRPIDPSTGLVSAERGNPVTSLTTTDAIDFGMFIKVGIVSEIRGPKPDPGLVRRAHRCPKSYKQLHRNHSIQIELQHG